MSTESYGMSNAGGSVAMSVDNSSIGSNDSHTHILNHQDNHIHNNYSVAASVVRGQAFAQGSFGKLYKGTYNGEDVAIKLLERPENDLDRAHLMEQQFQQEVMMLANLKHQNIVRFIGACRKPMLAVKQALHVARGMEYVHGLNLIHRDLKSDNLLIAADKSIKIADFGVARIEVLTEGMTPETGTYRWMAP
ncbi:hypothetical protein MTR67_053511 [Solanum verrucosum]|uniref:Protein kinase domain-containing protein n=1 Tax=Solanum verrucosum TaxID=315347 RepID=A0AAF0VAN1_SOLVR|nr:hypothetical protein MTR67_053511 [Solanum verrucosum]